MEALARGYVRKNYTYLRGAGWRFSIGEPRRKPLSPLRFTLLLFDHIHAGGVAAAFEFGVEEGVNDRQSQTFTHNAGTDREDVGVVVLTDHRSRKLVRADAATDAFDFVRGHHNALACAAEDNAQIAIARSHTLCRGLAMDGIMSADVLGRADVDGLITFGGDVGGDGLTQLDCGVVAREDDTCHCGSVCSGFRLGDSPKARPLVL